ncbi:PROTEIN PIN-LIKES 2 [Salix viminalis]|uniref:PROTEIN PIN-LIKES 2 n=1 Tax=Salix viminalis TaxID=40686 RepID=A0A9Q0U0K1_SALVM|nr:PROTEIN PIN-LIKES 2 [Salix viminalis]
MSSGENLLTAIVPLMKLICLIVIGLNIALWWFIPVNVLVSTVIGCLLGVAVVLICRPPPEFKRFTIIMTAFGNTGNLPLAIVGSVCHTKDSPFGPHCHSKGVAYVSFAQWVAVILVYTLVYHMMEPPMQYYEIVEEGSEIEEQPGSNVSRPLLVEAEWPGIEEKETEHSKTPFIARIFNSISSLSQTTFPDIDLGERSLSSPRSIQCLAEPRVVRRIRIAVEQTPIQHVLQPPTIASLLAIIIGMGPKESTLGLRTTIGITVARLLVLPLLGIGVVALADKLHLLVQGDAMYRFVLLLQYTTPSAILLGAIASLRGYAVKEASALLFWQHVFALFSLSLYIIIYFKLLTYI